MQPWIIAVVGAALIVAVVAFLVLKRRLRRQDQAHFIPPSGQVTMVVASVYRARDMAVLREMKTALEMYVATYRALLVACEGYEMKAIDSFAYFAFSCPVKAVDFALRLQVELLQLDWPGHILRGNQACNTVLDKSGEPLFRGLRVRCGIHRSAAVRIEMPDGRADFSSSAIAIAELIAQSAAGGQVLVTDDTLDAIKAEVVAEKAWILEYFGEYRFLEGDAVLRSVLPESLKNRNFTQGTFHRQPGRPGQEGSISLHSGSSAPSTQLSSETSSFGAPTSEHSFSLNEEARSTSKALHTISRWVGSFPDGVPEEVVVQWMGTFADMDVKEALRQNRESYMRARSRGEGGFDNIESDSSRNRPQNVYLSRMLDLLRAVPLDTLFILAEKCPSITTPPL
eukprot:TRINITY_DN27823_c0_g1_i1.p1 TRINITY_DN27823_c0_g1~~TRINITY_DN27823_c0_g1_i1.p1  ORF type:complete len:413 (+),score=95.62 TRINITY_DN27823_c0_g1_i1:49-1239(+)